ncbi:MAG TPA: hypothetical protein H9668_00010 [Firmicutes bacterium]|nr:hypothetical protein [Bacillota bacterium]
MPSTNKTSLGLNQWVLSDQPVMNDFNSDNAILNAAIAALQQPIGTARIADGAVTGDKIADGAVTGEKLSGYPGTYLDSDDIDDVTDPGLYVLPSGEILFVYTTSDPVGTAQMRINTECEIMYRSRVGSSDWSSPRSYIIPDHSITTSKLVTKAVTAEKLADGAVTAEKLADSAVTSEKLADGSITAEKIADGVVTSAKLDDDVIPAYLPNNKLLAGTGSRAIKALAYDVIDADCTHYRMSGGESTVTLYTTDPFQSQGTYTLSFAARLVSGNPTGFLLADISTSAGDRNQWDGGMPSITLSSDWQIFTASNLQGPTSIAFVTGVADTGQGSTFTFDIIDPQILDADGENVINLAALSSSSTLVTGPGGAGKIPSVAYVQEMLEEQEVPDGSITTAKLADGAVTSAKLAEKYLPYHPAAGADASTFQDPGLYTDDPAQPDTDINVYSHPYLVLPVPRKDFTGTQDRTIQIRFNAEICLLEFRFGFSGDWQPLGAQCNTDNLYSLDGLTAPGVYETGTDVYPSPEPSYYGSYTIIVSGNQYETRQAWMCTQNGHRHTRTLQAGSSSWSDFVSLDANT